MKRKVNGLVTVMTVALCGAAASAQPWLGPIGSRNRIEYTTGNVFAGDMPVTNDVIRFDVVDSGQTGNVITFHAFAGTPTSGVRTTAIWGESNNPLGRALQGFNFATNGAGVGVWCETASLNGIGVRGRATNTGAGQSFAGYFDNAGSGGVAMYGTTTSTTGSGVGVWGDVTANPTGYAFYGTGGRNYFQGNAGFGTQDPAWPVAATGATNHVISSVNTGTATLGSAVRGIIISTTPGTSETGVIGNVENATGANGIGVWGNGPIGLYGTTFDPANFAGFFRGKVSVQGDLGVVGALSKSSGSFLVDHPLDPANKYLYHSFVESPDMMNVYNGVIDTGPDGYADISMPEYFEALNSDFRYQLTIIDESDSGFAIAKVVRPINGNTFSIRTSLPNQKVSWQVTGIRQDAWAKAHRIVPEVNKVGPDRGRYLHPELFGATPDRAIHYGVGSVGQPEKSTVVSKGVVKSVTPVRVAPVSHEPPLTPAAQMIPAQR